MGRLLAILAVASSAACASVSTGAVPRPFPSPDEGPPPAATIPAAPASGYAIAGTALSLRGTPYRNGGADPAGFDCSGFIVYVFAQHGVPMPRTVPEQYRTGRSVDVRSLEPGDLVFFTTTAPGASHVGMSIGGDEFVHAPSSRGEVRVERLSSGYWGPRIVGARRVL